MLTSKQEFFLIFLGCIVVIASWEISKETLRFFIENFHENLHKRESFLNSDEISYINSKKIK